MGVVTVKVDVGNVYPPKPITVVIDDNEDNAVEYEGSFEEDFPLDEGRHTITITGMNQHGHKTVASVSGDIDPEDEQTSAKSNYCFEFTGDVSL